MDRRKVALIVAVIIFLSYMNYLAFYPTSQTQFHYEDILPETWKSGSNMRLICNNLQDTNVTIVFQNNRSLWYSIDITLYKPSHPWQAFRLESPRTGSLEMNALQRIESIAIVLGTGGYYDLFLKGKNLNASVIYNNRVILGNSTCHDSTGTFLFDATGKLYFTLNENVDCSVGGLDVIVGSQSLEGDWLFPDEVYLDVDVPDSLAGSLSIYDPTVQHFLENVGWYYRGNFTDSDSGDLFHRYATFNSKYFYQPYYLNFQELRAGSVYAQLRT
ncbi:MAG: hypothetical protein PVG65_01870 [Candidatus Thorarchaeota archaeon]